MPPKRAPIPPSPRAPLLRPPIVIALLVLLASIARIPLLAQSLWYDELFTVIHYVSQPWAKIVAGNYSPNNHVLFSIFAKLCTLLAGERFLEFTVRIPSLLAGALAGLLLALPLYKSHPKSALLLGLLSILHPWSVAISGWARGYALLLCLCTLATLLLMRDKRWPYAAAIVAALYTHPIAIAVVLGHGVSILLLKRTDWRRWFLPMAAAGVITALLYLPLLTGARGYWTAPERPSINYPTFLLQSLTHANAGDGLRSIGHTLTTLLVLVLGLPLAWRRWPDLRPMLLTFTVAGLFATLSPLLIPLSGEVRAMLWLIPLYCLGLFGLLTAVRLHPAIFLIPLAFFALRIVALHQTPGQAIREAVAEARQLADEQGRGVIAIYMASPEVRTFYVRETGRPAIDAIAMSTVDAKLSPGIREAERLVGGAPVAIVFYEDFMRRDAPDLWAHVEQNYRMVRHYPGRVSDVKIFVRNTPVDGR